MYVFVGLFRVDVVPSPKFQEVLVTVPEEVLLNVNKVFTAQLL